MEIALLSFGSGIFQIEKNYSTSYGYTLKTILPDNTIM